MANDVVYSIIMDLMRIDAEDESVYIDDQGVSSADCFLLRLVTCLENEGFEESAWICSEEYDPCLHHFVIMNHPNIDSKIYIDFRASDKVISKLITEENREILDPSEDRTSGYFADEVGWWRPDTFRINGHICDNEYTATNYIVEDVSKLLHGAA